MQNFLISRYLLLKRNQTEGFTLIELLVVIVILGILAAIALPSYLNQANRAKQADGETAVGVISRAQQTYYLDNGTFGTLAQLGLEEQYRDRDGNDYTFATTVEPTEAVVTATPKTTSLRGFAARTYTAVAADGNISTASFSCEGDPGETPALSGLTDCP